jgi:heat shock protein HtpX
MKRIVLFLVTNLAVMLVLSIAASVLGVNRYLTANGLNLGTLLVFAGIMGFGGAFISLAMSKMMAKWSTGARIIDSPSTSTEFWLVETVRKQAEKAGIAMPEVAIYEGEPNAFATGPSKNNSLVAVSTGLLQGMSKEEVEAVLAHEVSHVANGDMVTLTLIQGVVNTFVIFLSRIVGYLVDSFLRRGDSQSSGPGIGYTDHRDRLRHPVRHPRQHHRRLVLAPARIPRRRRRRRPDGFAAADDRGPGAPGRHGVEPLPKSLASSGIAGGSAGWRCSPATRAWKSASPRCSAQGR